MAHWCNHLDDVQTVFPDELDTGARRYITPICMVTDAAGATNMLISPARSGPMHTDAQSPAAPSMPSSSVAASTMQTTSTHLVFHRAGAGCAAGDLCHLHVFRRLMRTDRPHPTRLARFHSPPVEAL